MTVSRWWPLPALFGRTQPADANDSPVVDAGTPADDGRMPALRFDSHAAWTACLDEHEARLAARWTIECALPAAHDPSASVPGYCRFCRSRTSFALPSQERGAQANLREELLCRHCGLNARVRAGLGLLEDHVGGLPDPRIYITEQASPAFARLLRRYPGLMGSEYFHGEEARERLARYLIDLVGEPTTPRFGDVTALDFRDGAFDAVVSFDVLEHVPDYRSAMREFARVLKPGGALVLTAPFLPGEETTQTLARLRSDGSIEHLRSPEYHGDPLSPEGVLCFHHFGWDLLDCARQAGFGTAEFALPWDVSAGELGGCWTLVASR